MHALHNISKHKVMVTGPDFDVNGRLSCKLHQNRVLNVFQCIFG